ncbi:MAG TPA: alpha/beta hydrolase [Aquihabitans sp.]|nr:alpha/beta hydrolase [Aquihabitans sp.]
MQVATGSARIATTVRGEGPAVLLLHAGVTDRRSWTPLVDHLGPGWRTIAPDRRGFGETTYRPEPHRGLDDTLAVLDALGVDQAIVVGASNGGRRAVDLALARPERVGGLVLIGAGISGGPPVDREALDPAVRRLVARLEEADAEGDLDEVNRIEAHGWLDGWSAAEGRVGGAVRELFLEMNGIALAAPDPGPERDPEPAWGRLDRIDVPTLVLCGDLDALSLPASEHLAAAIPGATSEVLAGTAHLPHLEGHARALAVIDDFLDAVRR